MEHYSIYCTAEQTKKALKLGAPIEIDTIFESDHETSRDDKVHISKHLAKSAPYQEYATIPTAEQMCGWLRSQGVYISVLAHQLDETVCYTRHRSDSDYSTLSFPTYKEAMFTAIDEALEYLTKNKK